MSKKVMIYDTILEMFNVRRVYNVTEQKESNWQRTYNILVSSMSSISFGNGLTSFGTISNVMGEQYEPTLLTTLSTIAVSNLFLGGLIANFIVRLFPNIGRKYLLLVSSIVNGLSYLFQYLFPQIITVSITRVFIGISSGIVRATVPGYLHDNSTQKLSGFISSIHSIGISIGVMVGFGFGIWNSDDFYHIPMIIAISYFTLNTTLLLFIRETRTKQEELINHVGVCPLLRLNDARKSLLTCTLFHLSRHLSGVDFVALFFRRFMGDDPNYYVYYLSSMVLAIPVGLIGSVLLDKVGRKPMMLISLALLSIVTLLMGLLNWYSVLIYFFVISFNLGVAEVPWALPNEIFPKEYLKSGNMIGITVNWLSAYLLSIFAATIFEYFGELVFYIFSGSMASIFIYTCFVFKETKYLAVPQFQ